MSMTSAVTAGHITPNTSKQKWPVHILLCMTKPASKRKMFFPFAAKEPSQRSELNPIQHIGNQLERRVWARTYQPWMRPNPCSCAPTSGGKPSQKLLQWETLVLASPIQRLIQSVGVHVLLAMSHTSGLRTVRCSLWSVYWPSSDQTMLVPLIYTEASCPHHISFYITKIIGSGTVASCKNLYILIMLENNLRLSFTALCITVSYDHFYSKI